MVWRCLGVGQGRTFALLLVASCLALATACAGDSSVSFAPLPEFSGDDDDPSGATGGGPESGGSAAGASDTGGTSTMAGKGSVTGGSAGKSGGGGGGASAAGSPTGGKSQGGQSGGGMSGAGTSGTGNGGAAGHETGGGGMNDGGGKGGSAGNAGGGAAGSAGANGGGYCPFGFFDGHTYAFCPVVDSATAAFEKCKGLGMTLVSIESQAENAFVYAKQKSTWLGATDESLEGQWTWVSSGELFTSGKQPVEGAYTNWVSGQPNNSDKDDLPENCLALSASGWNDVGCDLAGFKATCESSGPIIGPSPF